MTNPFQSRRLSLLSVLFAVLSCAACTALDHRMAPESVGVSSDRLQRITAAMERAVDEGEIAGAVTLVARDGQIIHLAAFGHLDREEDVAMPTDALFRIASMTKPITSVAAMILIEEGRLLLSDPVSKFIPSFATTRFIGETADDRSAAAEPVTVRHLLTHTAGLSYGTGALERIYQASDLHMWYFADKDEEIAASIERLGTLPFAAKPGERWVYGFATDVLGAVIEKASGMPLDEFFETRIFDPLNMHDTSFYPPRSDAARLAVVYAAGPDGLSRATDERFGQGHYIDGPRRSFSGGAGLVSTASDYARFLQMLLNGGELDGVRVLSPKSVELMTTNHVGDRFSEGRLGFGFGFAIVEEVGRAGRFSSAGEYSWGGAYFTTFWVDPAERIIAIFMSQLLPSGGARTQERFRALVYQAIVDSAAATANSR